MWSIVTVHHRCCSKKILDKGLGESVKHVTTIPIVCHITPTLCCLSLSFYPSTPYHFRFDAWIPVCHSTCNTAYWLVLDDPSRHKTPAHRSSALTLQMLLPTSWCSTRRRRGLARAALLTYLLVHRHIHTHTHSHIDSTIHTYYYLLRKERAIRRIGSNVSHTTGSGSYL